jgi:hypothetical protein|tara:strand:+ start:2708 stop:3076 length:369 start_codon:yes stop_codon:yes gene_type:complete
MAITIKRSFKNIKSDKKPVQTKFSRSEYLDGQVEHQKYYAQMLNTDIIKAVVSSVGVDKILNSTDEHMNDIPLGKWDQATRKFHINKWPEGDSPSQAGRVCVAKAGAKEFLRIYQDGDVEMY